MTNEQLNELEALADVREAVPVLITALREAREELDFIKSEYGDDDEDQLTRDALLLKLRLQTSELNSERVSRKEAERLYGNVVLALTAAGADMYHPEDSEPFPVLAINRLVSERNTAQFEIAIKVQQNVALIDQNERLQQEVERLTAELRRMKSRPCEAEFLRLDVMWQELVKERDEAIAKSKEAFGGAFEAINSQLRYSSDAYITRITSEAFKRGVAEMRKAAVKVARKRADLTAHSYPELAWCRSAKCIMEEINDLPDPKDGEA